MENNNNLYTKENDTINIRAEIEKYLIHWKWFLVSIIICLSIAVLYAKSKVNIHETKAAILIKQDGGASSDLKVFQDLTSLGMGAESNVFDEIEILKSRTLGVAMVKKLNLNFEVYQEQGLKEVEVFQTIPFKHQVLSNQNEFYTLDTIVDIEVINQYSFKYQVEESDEWLESNFGQKLKLGEYEFLLVPTNNVYSVDKNNFYKITFSNIDTSIEKYKKSLIITSVNEGSNIISLTLNHPIKSKAQLVLNTLVNLYSQMSIDDKNEVGLKTAEFIDARLTSVKTELEEVDRLEERYKKNQQITDLEFQSQVFVDGKSENEKSLFSKETELRVVDFMIKNIESQNDNFELLPANIGHNSSMQLSESVINYNKVLLERNRLLRDSSLSNPVVISLNSELVNLRENIKSSLKNTREQLEISLRSLKNKEIEYTNKITSIPQQVKEYRSILRRQEIIAQLYSYLLQKKEENEISIAVTVSNAKVIDNAYSSKGAIAPRKPIIALIGLFIGVIFPFLVIYIRELLDTKFHSRSELEKYVSIPILGDIPFDKSEEKVIIKQGSRTSSAEAFRLLRTNLDFILSGVTEKSKVIFVTSTISGEGKTFVSVNTASSIALTGKKVLLVGMDLRAPKITQYLGLPNRSGVSNYLIGQEDKISDLVFPLPGYENLEILSSGIVPPNPAELLLNKRLNKMFEELKEQYDYIIVDTAPVNLVTDTLMMSKHADMFVYVARANYIDKRMLELSEKLYREKRLPNMAMLINGMDHERVYGYGVYGYGGYGYPDEEENKNFFQRLFKR
ncbi:GumC family protein [Wenyingzhuangia sp. IMCC45467]